MTQEEIIEMARQVGYPIQHSEWQKATEEFAALVAAKEREECADLLEFGYIDDENHHLQYAYEIRARGKQA